MPVRPLCDMNISNPKNKIADFASNFQIEKLAKSAILWSETKALNLALALDYHGCKHIVALCSFTFYYRLSFLSEKWDKVFRYFLHQVLSNLSI